MDVAVRDRMATQIAEWDSTGDGRVVFLECYLRMTRAVADRVDEGAFADGVWVDGLLDRFADYYFASIDGGPDAAPVPEPWILAHAAAVGNDAHPLQLLLAGVNAHINYDLVLTLIDVLDEEWADGDHDLRCVRRADYDLINRIIADTADLVQDEVVETRAPWLDVLDRGLGRWDERAAVRLLGGWRSRVWRQATGLLDDAAPLRTDRVRRIEAQCARRARWLLA